jgi:hypothetical protein
MNLAFAVAVLAGLFVSSVALCAETPYVETTGVLGMDCSLIKLKDCSVLWVGRSTVGGMAFTYSGDGGKS